MAAIANTAWFALINWNIRTGSLSACRQAATSSSSRAALVRDAVSTRVRRERSSGWRVCLDFPARSGGFALRRHRFRGSFSAKP